MVMMMMLFYYNLFKITKSGMQFDGAQKDLGFMVVEIW